MENLNNMKCFIYIKEKFEKDEQFMKFKKFDKILITEKL